MTNENMAKVRQEILKFIDESKIRPDARGMVNINLSEIMKISPIFVDDLLENFKPTFKILEETLKDSSNDFDYKPFKTVNILSHKSMHSTPIENLTFNKENKLLKFEGFIISASDIITQTIYHYTCPECQRKYVEFKPVKECRSAKCRQYISENDGYKEVKNYRELVFQEQITGRTFCEVIPMILNIPENEESRFITFPELFGNKLEIMGIIKLVEAGLGTDKRPIFKTMIEIYGIQKINQIELKPERMIEVKDFIEEHRKDLIKICAEHIGCNIYGYEYEKQAMLLTVIGLEKDCPSIGDRNTQMTTIIFSDAGKGKSHLSKAFMSYVPNSIYVTSNTSKAGLVGGVEKTSSGTYMFTMGELPYANNSFAILDEIDKLDSEQSDVMLTVISEGILKITKIKKFEMPVHINFIIQGNPKNSFFDPFVPYFSQLTLTRPFLDRGDFIIIFHDPYDENNEESVTEFGKAVLSDGKKKWIYDDKLIKDTMFFIKNYVPNPEIDDNANEQIIKYWRKLKDLRNKIIQDKEDKKEDVRTVGARTLVSLTKISLVVARFRMNEIVTDDDIDTAYNIYYNASIKNLIKDYGGLDAYAIKTVDMRGNILSPKTSSQLNRWILQRLSKEKDGIMDIDELSEEINTKFEFPQTEIDTQIEKLKITGEVSFPRNNLIKLIL